MISTNLCSRLHDAISLSQERKFSNEELVLVPDQAKKLSNCLILFLRDKKRLKALSEYCLSELLCKCLVGSKTKVYP